MFVDIEQCLRPLFQAAATRHIERNAAKQLGAVVLQDSEPCRLIDPPSIASSATSVSPEARTR
jgi:hypothetical protein